MIENLSRDIIAWLPLFIYCVILLQRVSYIDIKSNYTFILTFYGLQVSLRSWKGSKLFLWNVIKYLKERISRPAWRIYSEAKDCFLYDYRVRVNFSLKMNWYYSWDPSIVSFIFVLFFIFLKKSNKNVMNKNINLIT